MKDIDIFLSQELKEFWAQIRFIERLYTWCSNFFALVSLSVFGFVSFLIEKNFDDLNRVSLSIAFILFAAFAIGVSFIFGIVEQRMGKYEWIKKATLLRKYFIDVSKEKEIDKYYTLHKMMETPKHWFRGLGQHPFFKVSLWSFIILNSLQLAGAVGFLILFFINVSKISLVAIIALIFVILVITSVLIERNIIKSILKEKDKRIIEI